MKPYSSSTGDILLGMVVFSTKNTGSWGVVEKFQSFVKTMQGLFIQYCRIGVMLDSAGIFLVPLLHQ